jgi:hypothetical protein
MLSILSLSLTAINEKDRAYIKENNYKWNVIKSTGYENDFEVVIDDQNKLQTQICFWSKTATNPAKIPNSYNLYDSVGNILVTLNKLQRTISGVSKVGYCRVVATERYLQFGLNSIVLIYEQEKKISFFIDEKNNISATLYKKVGDTWNNAINDIFVYYDYNKWKFGAYDSYSLNDGNDKYKYVFESSQPILKESNYYVTGGYKIDMYDICNNVEPHLITRNGNSTYFTPACIFSLPDKNNSRILEVEFYNYNGTIDPTFSIAQNTTNSLNTNTTTEQSNYTHLTTNALGKYFASFDASDDYIYIADNDRLDTGNISFTVTAWVYGKAYAGDYRNIVSKASSALGKFEYSFYYDNAENKFCGIIWNGAVSANTYVCSVTPSTNQWYFLVFSQNTTTNNISITVNGGNRVEKTRTVTPVASTSPINIGRYSWDGSQYWSGYIDDVMIFNKSLSMSEIIAINASGRAGNYTDSALMARYNFNDRQSNFKDSIGTNDGTPYNGAYTLLDETYSYNTYAKLNAYWSFDADTSTTVYDFTDNSNDGTYYGAIYNSAGKYDNGVYFDGINDYVDFGDPSSIELTNMKNFSISAWVKMYSGYSCTYCPIVIKTFGSGNDDVFLTIGQNGANTNQLCWYMEGAGGGWQCATPALNTNQWYYVTLTYNRTHGTSYINGTQVKQTTTGLIDVDESHNWYLGQMPTEAWDTPLKGWIDDVMIFSKVLTSTEVSNIYASNIARFYPSGTQTFTAYNLSSGSPAYANFTLLSAETNYSTTLAVKVNNGAVKNFTNGVANGYTLTGDLDRANISLLYYTNNTAFYTPINLGNLSIVTYGVTSDTTPPTWTEIPANKTAIYSITSIYTDFNATDNVAISQYWINDTRFNINITSGVFTNSSLIPIGSYDINVSVNDTSNNRNYLTFNVNVIPVITNILGTPLQIWRNYTTKRNITILDNEGNLYIYGNLNVTKNIFVSGCIVYNGGTLGTCV